MSTASILRPWTINDLPTLVQLANNPEIAKYLTNHFPHPYTEEDGKVFLEKTIAEQPFNVFAITCDGQVAGSVGIFMQSDIHAKSAEVGYFVGEAYWGRGLAVAAVREIVEYGKKNWDIRRIYARPFGTNIRSKRVLEKAGFKLEACLKDSIYKNGKFEDELIYSILIPHKS